MIALEACSRRQVTKPYEFIGFGAMEVPKPYEFLGIGAMEVTKPYEFIGFGARGRGRGEVVKDRKLKVLTDPLRLFKGVIDVWYKAGQALRQVRLDPSSRYGGDGSYMVCLSTRSPLHGGHQTL